MTATLCLVDDLVVLVRAVGGWLVVMGLLRVVELVHDLVPGRGRDGRGGWLRGGLGSGRRCRDRRNARRCPAGRLGVRDGDDRRTGRDGRGHRRGRWRSRATRWRDRRRRRDGRRRRGSAGRRRADRWCRRRLGCARHGRWRLTARRRGRGRAACRPSRSARRRRGEGDPWRLTAAGRWNDGESREPDTQRDGRENDVDDAEGEDQSEALGAGHRRTLPLRIRASRALAAAWSDGTTGSGDRASGHPGRQRRAAISSGS